MGSAAGPASAGLSLAGLGLSAYGETLKGKGQAAASDAKAARLDRAAQFGKMAATQTAATLTEDLNTTLGNIATMRAAGHADPTSPTSAAVMDQSSRRAAREIAIRTGNYLEQARQDEADAAYLRQAGAYALGMGNFNAFATLVKGAGPALGSPSFGLGKSGGGKTNLEQMPDDI